MTFPKFLRPALSALSILAFVTCSASRSAAQSSLPSDNSEDRPFGIRQRMPWTTSRISGSPSGPSPYLLNRAFPNLKFNNPIDICSAPGTDRIIVAELGGKIFSFPNSSTSASPDLIADLKPIDPEFKETYGITFDPGFQTNRYFYICYVLKDSPNGSRVSRFKVSNPETLQIDLKSELILITWLSGGHNGGCLKFGPDGYLYISTGDGAGPVPPDPLNTGQDNSDLLSAVLRIDVKDASTGKPYRVPLDNPFVNVKDTRPEIWSYGFRNPWKMSFDRKDGHLWLADVGWELWELVYKVERGGNYGWSVVEGRQDVKPDAPRGPTPILPPIKDHPHHEAASITGGYVYRGNRLRDLVGAYVYGDYETGKIWALRAEGQKAASVEELLDSTSQIISFAEDPSGELLVMDYAGLIYHIVPNPSKDEKSTFPRKLSETGLFSSLQTLKPSDGVVPYSVIAEPWADYAVADRVVALPGSSSIEVKSDRWIYPKDSVFARTLSLEMERGNPKSLRRLETQILHYDGIVWNAYTYQWNKDQTDASLVPAEGANATLHIKDPQVPGGMRKQHWRFNSHAECLRCHNPWSGSVLGFNPFQLSKTHAYEHPDQTKVADEQFRTLAHIKIFAGELLKQPKIKLTSPADQSAGLAERARSYLHVNCAHCHRLNAGGSVLSQMNIDAPLDKATLIDTKPAQGNFGIQDGQIIAAADAYRSVLYYRIATPGQGHMPRIGSVLVDDTGVKLVHDWINSLPAKNRSSEAASQDNLLLGKIASQYTSDQERIESIASLLSSTRGTLALLHSFVHGGLSDAVRKQILAAATSHTSFQARDLFERFLPEDKRVRKLGTQFDPESVLALKGDAAKGKSLLQQNAGLQCLQCHRLLDEGKDFGPDLSQIGRKYDRRQLLDHITHPSKLVDPAFVTYQVESKDELVYSGLLVKKTEMEIELKDTSAQIIRLQTGQIRSMQPQQLSAMPEHLLQGITADEAADLLEYLSSLR